MTSDLTTKAAEIRAGFVADWRKAMEGVTPGPWLMKDFDTELSVSTTDGSAPLIADLIEQGDAEEPGHWGSEYQIGQWIARCSPSGIASLLALIEQQAAELAEARAELVTFVTAHALAGKRATTAESERDELLREKERLAKLSDRYGVALMMIRAGCSQPQRFAGNILDDKEPVEIDLEDCDEDHR